MDSVDYDVNDFNERYAADKSVYAKFYTLPRKDEKASAEAGRAIFKDREYIEIRAAGNQNNIIQRPSNEMDRRRFHRQYELYQKGHEEQVTGTPLSEVTWLTRSQVEELAYVRIRTLEQLAGVTDDICQRMVGLNDLKRKAATFLEAADKAAPLTALQEENQELKGKVEALSEQLKAVTAQLKKLNKGDN